MLRLLGAGIALTILGSNFASAASVSSPGDIGKSWPDRRPMGRIIFANPASVTATNLNGWTNGGPIALGTPGFQASILGTVDAALLNTNKMRGQGIIIWDITGDGCTNRALGNEFYLGDPRFLNPVASGLTVASAFAPFVPPGSPLGKNGIEPAMNAIADQVFAKIAAAGLKPGICIRGEKIYVNSSGDLDGSKGQFGESQVFYDLVSHQLADLDAKVTYAKNRWGIRVFYVDSNIPSNDVKRQQQIVGLPTYTPAYIYTQLYARHPDCVFFPEEAYSMAFNPPAPLDFIRDPAFQYEKVASRYTALSAPYNGPFLSSNEIATVPDAFTMIDVSNMGSSDPSDTANVVAALKAHQCILLANAWWDDPAITLANNWQIAANVNGFGFTERRK